MSMYETAQCTIHAAPRNMTHEAPQNRLVDRERSYPQWTHWVIAVERFFLNKNRLAIGGYDSNLYLFILPIYIHNTTVEGIPLRRSFKLNLSNHTLRGTPHGSVYEPIN